VIWQLLIVFVGTFIISTILGIWISNAEDKHMLKEKKKIQVDLQGSYTGRPEDPYEVPVQDADDL
jgi:hypothetical protein